MCSKAFSFLLLVVVTFLQFPCLQNQERKKDKNSMKKTNNRKTWAWYSEVVYGELKLHAAGDDLDT